MTFKTITKTSAERARAAMPDTDAARAGFSWEAARARLAGLPEGGSNIAHEALDRHVAAGHGDQVAIRVVEWSDEELLQVCARGGVCFHR